MSQIRSKFIQADAVTTAKVIDGAITNAKIATGVDAAKIADGSVSNTEFQYLNTVTSNIQTQLDGKQATGNYITDLIGDGTASGPGSANLTLSTVNSNTGSFGSSTAIPSFTVNGKGLITAASTNAVIAPAGTLTGTTLASNVVSSSLTSLGTIATGVWDATTIAVNRGGTGQTTYTDGQLLIGNSTGNTLAKSTLTAGANVTITNGSGSITVAAPSILTGFNYISVTSSTTLTINDYAFLSGASFSFTLPTAVGNAGKGFAIQHAGTSLTQVYTINTTSSQTIGGIAGGSYSLYTNGEFLMLISDGSNWQILSHRTDTAWTSYTPTLVGFGTTTNVEFRYRRSGTNIEIMGKYTAGTNTATEARIPLPSSTTSADSSTIPSIRQCGTFVYATNSASFSNALIEPSVTYITLGVQSSSQSGLTKVNGNTYANSVAYAVWASLPVSGWQP